MDMQSDIKIKTNDLDQTQSSDQLENSSLVLIGAAPGRAWRGQIKGELSSSHAPPVLPPCSLLAL